MVQWYNTNVLNFITNLSSSSSFVSQVRVRVTDKGVYVKEIVDSAVNRNYLMSVMTPKWLSSATVKNPMTAMAINRSM